MQVDIHANHVQLSDRLRETVARKVAHAARMFDSDRSVIDVEVDEERNPRLADGRFRIEITAPVAGHVVRVEAAGPDGESALDAAVDKFEKRLRRLKGRLITRSRTGDHKRLNQGTSEVEREEQEPPGPEIVRVKQFDMKPMTPEEAALQMDMLDHDFFFFLNGETELPSVIYRRRNGTLGLIEPA